MQGSCNKTYDNAHEIIGWDTNKGQKDKERWKLLMEDASDVVNVGGSM